jgi:alkylmercury lyase
MTTTNTSNNELTRRLMAWNDGLGWVHDNGRLMGAAIVELSGGDPVGPEQLATRAALPVADVREFLRSSPAEWDDQGRLVGFGLTLRQTRHRYTTSGRTLYTWCAPDALAFPVLTGEPALVESTCLVTGEAIRVEVAPDGVRAVAPAGAVVSIVPRDVAVDELRERLCHEQHFFVSSEVAESWRREREDVIVVAVADAFEPLRRLMQRWAPEASEAA